MSVINSIPLIAAGDDGYQISRSVRLRSSASAYFNRTLTTPTNNKIWTWSGWVKRGKLGSAQAIIGTTDNNTASGNFGALRFNASDYLEYYEYASAYTLQISSNGVYRDPSAWYHIVVAIDTTQATAANRTKFYVNGVAVAMSLTTSPALNYNTFINSAVATYQGAYNNSGTGVLALFDGYLTEVNFIDGQALTPSSFGQNDPVTGVWQPKKYVGSYGTNGFYLNFSDNSAATATTIGKDYSGNGNNWTPNNISVTAGVTYDSMLDVPTMWADGGNGRGNYCVFNPLVGTHSNTYSNGNLQVATSTANAAFSHQRATFGLSSGKWYWEITCQATSSAYYIVGITADTVNPDSQYVGQGNSYCYRNDTGQKGNNGTFSSYGATFTTGDIIGVEFDADAGTLVFYKNGTSQGTAFTGISGTYFPAVADLDNNTSRNSTFIANFGQRPFSYTPPTGFVALNTQNLPAPTISNGAQYMAASTYTGTGATQSIVNSGNNAAGISFQPDFVWIKDRSAARSHRLFDAVRGATKALFSDATDAETTLATDLTAFNSNGFTLGAGAGSNSNTETFVGWQWKASGSTVSNTSGSITSTVSAGATQGFSVVTYTGTGANATVGHGLGVAPAMTIVKRRNAVQYWAIWHNKLTSYAYELYFNTSDAQALDNSYTANPSSTVLSLGSGVINNASGGTYVAYCFAEVAGYSKFGSYTGNGNSSDGPFVYCGFRPRFVMFKRADSLGNWEMIDSSRNTYNAVNLALYANLSAAEDTSPTDDFLANGFKIRTTDSNQNTSGGTYIFAAFAENPFKNSLAR